MRLDELMNTIAWSGPTNWHGISSFGTGPWCRCCSCEQQGDPIGGAFRLEHYGTAVYVPDIAITIAFGLAHGENFGEAWARKFPDPNASSAFVDVLYGGVLVYRDVYVDVDGGRAKLPIPRPGTLEVPALKATFFSLLNTFEYESQFDEYFRRAGFEAVDEPWPAFAA